MYHISFDIIFLLTSVFLDLSIYGIDLIPTLLLDTNNEEIYSYYNIEIQKENSILISKNLSRMFSNQNLNNSYSFKILLFFFLKKNFKTAIFRIIPLKNTSLWRLLLMILNSVDQVIFHKLHINKRLISFLNETDILKNLKTVHFWLAESNSNILSYIETILYAPNIFIEYNDCIQQSMYEKIKMKPLSIIKIVSIFIDCILNLPGIEILYLYDCNIGNYDEFHIYPKNYSITTFSFLGKKMINVNLFYKFMCSMIKLTNLEICNDSLSLLLDKDQNSLFSHIIHLNILDFCCVFKIYTNNNSFYFPFFISEEISVGVGFPAGTLKKIFSIQENLNIKKLLYSENFFDDSDSRALEYLNFLDSIELSSNIVEIRFHELFDINKTYKLKTIELKEMELNFQDIMFISSLNNLEILNLINCGFEKDCYRNIKGNDFKNLKFFYFEYFSFTKNKKIIKHLKEEFSSFKGARREFMARNVAMQALNEKLMKDQIKVLNLWADYFEGYLNEKTKKGKRPQLFEIGGYIFPEKRESFWRGSHKR
ncbi:hypothetical protein CWI38_0716p0010 [Hamiltosporidium tvaerminnensis]|uniref:Uncharacterized protein n=1 Tax=Hamiltosporidium tvaerminnensis TaxID=1176355 RepID=A0A4Q9LV34_9MICR|nr:hypothetical protein CWI38_0716p0010 [Hamiltosporidium tvaerminnensis]